MLMSPLPALAIADPKNPDWPCVQKKLDNLSASTIWDGPPIDGIKDWARDEKITALVQKLATRRVSIEKAKEAIGTFAAGEAEGERDVKLTKVFTGLFELINGQRRSVLSGIEKYQRAQKARAAELEKQGVNIAELQGSVTVDDTAAVPPSEAEEKEMWAGRIFQERQANLVVACELPQIIEERLGELARAIREKMSK